MLRLFQHMVNKHHFFLVSEEKECAVRFAMGTIVSPGILPQCSPGLNKLGYYEINDGDQPQSFAWGMENFQELVEMLGLEG